MLKLDLLAGRFRAPRFFSANRALVLLAMWMLFEGAQAGNDAQPRLAAQISTPNPTTEAANSPSEMNGFIVVLEDEVRDMPNSRIKWNTHWTLCWDEFSNALAYQIETMTGEGKSPHLITQQHKCKRIEVASGENKASLGLVSRDLQIALQSGQLAYRVRAVLPGEHNSPWSAYFAVGRVEPLPAWQGAAGG